MKIPFKKMSGAGNDFIVVDWRRGPGPLPWGSLAKGMCDRRSGIGADGLIVIRPGEGADFIMDYFNADGTSGSMCGNGGRCASLHMMGQLNTGHVTFSACGRRYSAMAAGKGVSLTMQDPEEVRLHVRLTLRTGALVGHFIDTGAPHLVIRGDSSIDTGGRGEGRDVDFMQIGREVRYLPEFGERGTNVDFIWVEAPDRIRVRTYEKGVEGETLACGTGAVASAAVYSILEGREGENLITVLPESGDILLVGFDRTGERLTRVRLEGPAVVTFTGIVDIPE